MTELLKLWRHGDSTALEKLLPLVYNELRRIAEQQLRRERPNHTLHATALVHELYLKFADQHSIEWQNRAQFFGVAAQLIRRILVDHVRNQRTAKRGGGTLTLTLDDAVSQRARQDIDLMKLDDALLSLSRKDEQRSRVVEYWPELLAYIDSAYAKKLGHHYPWSNLARKNLWNLARVHSAWGVMALWDLYLEGKSWWAGQTTWSVYGMIRDTGWLLDDPRFKQLAAKHEESLAKQSFGRFINPADILNRMEIVARRTQLRLSTYRSGSYNPIVKPTRFYPHPRSWHSASRRFGRGPICSAGSPS